MAALVQETDTQFLFEVISLMCAPEATKSHAGTINPCTLSIPLNPSKIEFNTEPEPTEQ